jgi:hypothetical protein
MKGRTMEPNYANGYKVECLQSGQIGRYGPTLHMFIVTDLTQKRTPHAIREYCVTRVFKADTEIKDAKVNHLQEFTLREDGSYLYVCGSDECRKDRVNLRKGSAMTYIAMFKDSKQIAVDDWRSFQETLVCRPETTLAEIADWYDEHHPGSRKMALHVEISEAAAG